MHMTNFLRHLEPPKGPIDVVMDTDAYNEIDDQFAISYLLSCREKFRIQGICAAPFFNTRSVSPEDGMEKSYGEILRLLTLTGCEDLKDLVYRGSTRFL